MTGLHTGHCLIHGNGILNLRPDDVTVADHADLVAKLEAYMQAAHTESELRTFPSARIGKRRKS